MLEDHLPLQENQASSAVEKIEAEVSVLIVGLRDSIEHEARRQLDVHMDRVDGIQVQILRS